MTMQIKEITLYSNQGDIRTISFKSGKVNIITGKSGTGKSAIISIIDYCLGRSDFNIPDGVIRDSVAWFAIKLTINNSEIFIAKPTPKGNAASQSTAFLKVGSKVETPKIDDLIINSNDDAINEYLSRIVGIVSNINEPPKNQTRDSLEANFKHTKYYLFQNQSLVANEQVLFHRQNEAFMPQAIKDTIPYFLGAVRDDTLNLKKELRANKRKLKSLQKKINEAEMLSGKGITQASGLLKEAKAVDLIDNDISPTTNEELVNILKGVLLWEPTPVTHTENDKLNDLFEERKKLLKESKSISEKIKQVISYEKMMNSYTKEVGNQVSRLESIGLYNEAENAQVCPLCSSNLVNVQPTVKEIMNSLSSLSKNLSTVDTGKAHLEGHLNKLSEKLSDIKEELQEKDLEIEMLSSLEDSIKDIKDANNKKAIVIGRISLFLENIKPENEMLMEKKEIEELESIISDITARLDRENTEELTDSILNIIGTQMTKWAEYLQLEHSSFPYRLDLKNLTIVADTDERPIPMFRMGSGENWLGCHLIALLALHKFFINKSRPIPGFLVLDQPTQVYFPPEIYNNLQGDVTEIADEDSIAVKRMYDLLFDVCEELYPDFQIVVLDHANLNDIKFQNSLIEEPWRNGNALIPSSWLIK
ncbi:DUF3732 domain-containing protein [Niallia sp. Krafla_26]|uniref:DUF3732 domain-containing protein n=1 Tax=Niallia sp. Krafla_26 TaxID=3064703 RepID=UPI003D185308